MSKDTLTYAVMAKPVSGRCNLQCTYCYYLEKPKLLHQTEMRMSQDVLKAYILQTLEVNGKDAEVSFAWHGGEPLLAGLPFYREAMAIEKAYGKGRKITNTLQTNGTLLTYEWCRFFKENGFLLGVSIDGSEALHDTYRRCGQGGSFQDTLRGMELLKKHSVPFNTLTTINATNALEPDDVYAFLRTHTWHMQFLPVVEDIPAEFEREDGQLHAAPPGLKGLPLRHPAAKFSVNASQFGDFMIRIFDLWHEKDVDNVYIQLFEATLGNMTGRPGGLCTHEATCGHAPVVEANGDVYSCDRYAFPAYKLGNLLKTPLAELIQRNKPFGMHKTYGLPQACFACPYIKLCFGGCPKDRPSEASGKQGQNALCDGYKKFFAHFTKHMERTNTR